MRERCFVFAFILTTLACGFTFLDDFEGSIDWSTIWLSDLHHSGSRSRCWNNSNVVYNAYSKNMTNDWSHDTFLNIWIYSATSNNAVFYLLPISENTSTSGQDYYSQTVTLSFTGWKRFRLDLAQFGKSRSPRGWNQIDRLLISSYWGGLKTPNDTFVCFDEMYLFSPVVDFPQSKIDYVVPPGTTLEFPVIIQNLRNVSSDSINVTAIISSSAPPGLVTMAHFVSTSSKSLLFSLFPSELMYNEKFKIMLSSSTSFIGSEVSITLIPFVTGMNSEQTLTLVVTIKIRSIPTPPPKTHPFLYINSNDISSLKAKALAHSYTSDYLKKIISWGEESLKANTTIPTELSWSDTYYVCNDGKLLSYDPENPYSHWCSTESIWYKGQPWDGAWVELRHLRNADWALKAAISYAFSGNRSVGRLAAKIFLDYATIYPSLPIHGTDGYNTLNTDGGARIQSETLSETNWADSVSWGYDLIYDLLSDDERVMIEFNLMRPVVELLQGNNAGTGNWQSQHNLGIGLIGFSLGDQTYIESAINGSSGFKFQVKNSILDDGLWIEGTLGYHFIALDGLERLAEVALVSGGIDLFHYSVPRSDDSTKAKSLLDMYLSPLLVSLPDLSLPKINDGDGTLTEHLQSYEIAYTRFPEQTEKFSYALCKIIASSTIGRSSMRSFLIGRDLPSWCTSSGTITTTTTTNALGSLQMESSGLSILRTVNDDYVLLDNGAHGGWHGHYDKFSLIFYSHSNLLITDPGTISYLLPLYPNYFKRTLPHSTIMVDGICQIASASKGILHKLGSMVEEIQLISATSPVLDKTGVKAQRTILLIHSPKSETSTNTYSNEYPLLLDILEGISNKTHFYDSIFHSTGSLSFEGTTTINQVPISTPGTDIAWTYISDYYSFDTTSQFTATWYDAIEYSQHFEVNEGWTNIVISKNQFHDGSHSGHWFNHTFKPKIVTSSIPENWSQMKTFSVWIYSVIANSAKFSILLLSNNPNTTGTDYYYVRVTVDWTGWKQLQWNKTQFVTSKQPLGWDQIKAVYFDSSWFDTPLNNTDLYVDCLTLLDSNGNIIGGDPKGLRIISPKTPYNKQVISSNNALSIPASKHHPMISIRKQTNLPSVHLLSSVTSRKDFVQIATSNDDATSISITTLDRSYQFTRQMNSNIPSCFITTVTKESQIERIVGYKCSSYEWNAVHSFQIAASSTEFDFQIIPALSNSTTLEITVQIGGGSTTITVGITSITGISGISASANGVIIDGTTSEQNGKSWIAINLNSGTYKLIIQLGQQQSNGNELNSSSNIPISLLQMFISFVLYFL